MQKIYHMRCSEMIIGMNILLASQFTKLEETTPADTECKSFK